MIYFSVYLRTLSFCKEGIFSIENERFRFWCDLYETIGSFQFVGCEERNLLTRVLRHLGLFPLLFYFPFFNCYRHTQDNKI
jgi:hypothetical protein